MTNNAEVIKSEGEDPPSDSQDRHSGNSSSDDDGEPSDQSDSDEEPNQKAVSSKPLAREVHPDSGSSDEPQ